MKSMLRTIQDGDKHYPALMFVCPGCALGNGSGLHMIAVNTDVVAPSWKWNGKLDYPTIEPSILTKSGEKQKEICHSYLTAGVFKFLSDCTHAMKDQFVPMPDLPEWVIREGKTDE